MRFFCTLLIMAFGVSCASTPPTQVKENRSEKYNSLRGKRYVIYAANSKNEHTEAARQIENRIKAHLADKGLVVVDFAAHSLANILNNDGSIVQGQAKRVASNADLIVTGRYVEEQLKDDAINKSGTFRTRIRASFAITESNSSIEKARFEEEIEQMASSWESATSHAAIAIGKEIGQKIIDKLFFIYD